MRKKIRKSSKKKRNTTNHQEKLRKPKRNHIPLVSLTIYHLPLLLIGAVKIMHNYF